MSDSFELKHAHCVFAQILLLFLTPAKIKRFKSKSLRFLNISHAAIMK